MGAMDADQHRIVKLDQSSGLPLSSFIVPFVFEKEEYHVLADKLVQSGKWQYSREYANDNELYDHIQNLIRFEGPRTEKEIGVSLEYNKNLLQNKKTNEYFYRCGETHSYFRIDEAKLFLFSTSVGFLVYNVSGCSSDNMEELIERNSQLKALKQAEGNIFALSREGLFPSQDVLVDIGDLSEYDGLIHTVAESQAGSTISVPLRNGRNVQLKLTKNCWTMAEKPDEKYKFCLVDRNANSEDPDKILPEQMKIENRNGLVDLRAKRLPGEILFIPIGQDPGIVIDSAAFIRPDNGRYKIRFYDAVDWRKVILGFLEGIDVAYYYIEHFSKSQNSMLPSKAIFFGCCASEIDPQNKENLFKLFFRFRKGYNLNHEGWWSHELDISSNSELLRRSEDIMWGMSREGVGCLVMHNTGFVRNNLLKRLNNYFYLYILVLHQYFGILKLSREVSEISGNIDQYTSDPSKYENLILLRNRVNFFVLKCMFCEVSHITHQAEYYQHTISQLGIYPMLQELQTEIDRISSIVSIVKEKHDESIENQKEARRQQDFLAIKVISALFSVIVAAQVLWQLMDSWQAENGNPISFTQSHRWNEVLTIITILVGLGVIGFVVFLGIRIHDRRKRAAEKRRKLQEPLDRTNNP